MIRLVIFDLDDVLFSERDYIKSGFGEVAKILSSNKDRQKELVRRMLEIFEINPYRVFNQLVSEIKDLSTKESVLVNLMINTYHNHKSSIHLYPDSLLVLKTLRKKGIHTAILSDGREKSQRLKIESLSLANRVDQIILTDSLGPNRKFWKPNPYAFRLLVNDFGVEPNQACYIGDNATKDFGGPNKIGMKTVLIQRQDGLYIHTSNSIIEKNQAGKKPDYIINSLYEIEQLSLFYNNH